jgi:hypothetical protein
MGLLKENHHEIYAIAHIKGHGKDQKIFGVMIPASLFSQKRIL